MLSGGDLDGDLYNLIYDHRLYPNSVFDPADYPTPNAIDIGRPVERKDMTDFFIDFMRNDKLGLIATLHQILADQKPDGVFDAQCVLLAELHSTAVDFSKTGIPVSIFQLLPLSGVERQGASYVLAMLLTNGTRCDASSYSAFMFRLILFLIFLSKVNFSAMPKYPKTRPDFQAPGPRVLIDRSISFAEEEPSHDSDEDEELAEVARYNPSQIRYYESEKILGRLYREIDEKKFLEQIQEQSLPTTMIDQHPLEIIWKYVNVRTVLIQWTHLLDFARSIKDK